MCHNCHQDGGVQTSITPLRKFGKILRRTISILLALYIVLILLLHLPFVQRKIGEQVASALSEKLGSKVTVESVNLGFLNRVIIDDIEIEDLKGKQMLKIARASCSFELFPLFSRKFYVSTAQLFGVNANLYKETPESPYNFDFVIKAFSSKEDKEQSPLQLRINSLIVRRADIHFDVLSEPHKEKGQFDANHFFLQNTGITAALKELDGDNVNLVLRRLSFKEANSGFELNRLATHFEKTKNQVLLSDFEIETAHSQLDMDSLLLRHSDQAENRTFTLKTRLEDAVILPADFTAFAPKLQYFDTPYTISCDALLTQDDCQLQGLKIDSEADDLKLLADIHINTKDKQQPDVNVNIEGLTLLAEKAQELISNFLDDERILNLLHRIGDVHLSGQASTQGGQTEGSLNIRTDIGDLVAEGNFINKQLVAHIETEGLNLGSLLDNPQLGTAIFNLDIDGDRDNADITGVVSSFDYADYTYKDIDIAGQVSPRGYDGHFSINDENINMVFDGKLSGLDTKQLLANLELDIANFNPHALHLTEAHAGESYSFRAKADLQGSNLQNVTGELQLDSIHLVRPDRSIYINNVRARAKETEGKHKHLEVESDFLQATLDGDIDYREIVPSLTTLLAQHLPSLVKAPSHKPVNSQFTFEAELTDAPLLHLLLDKDFAFHQPIQLKGDVNVPNAGSSLRLSAPSVNYEGSIYENIALNYNGTSQQCDMDVSLHQLDQDNNRTKLNISAKAHEDRILSQLKWDKRGEKPMRGDISAVATFVDSLGITKSHIALQPSTLSLNDTLWQLTPSFIDIYGKKITCHHLKLSHGSNRFITINGQVSEQPSDAITAELSQIDVSYLQALTRFKNVKFGGLTSGTARVSNVFAEPQLDANLHLTDFTIRDGVIGSGDVTAKWNNAEKSIVIDGVLHDQDEANIPSTTTVNGFIVPSTKAMELNIGIKDTSAEFLNGFLGRTFRDIKGKVNGEIQILGPTNDVNIVGNVSADIDMTLKATGVTYHVDPRDSLHMRPFLFSFDNMRIYDKHHNQGIVNGTLAHRNMKNFEYHFDVDLSRMLAYEATTFNADKFMGTIFANGHMTVDGHDGHPLHINADMTPTRGSMFAYDSASPDAVTKTSFVTFRDPLLSSLDTTLVASDPTSDYTYRGDIYMDVNIHMTPDCEIKLRMDNVEDGYISTHGTGTLQAHYHNKSPFTLNGVYDITSGSYRLYLQDVIHRDLALQQGSRVVFNGNPFDADIHLICWHTLNSVPLTDLTPTATFNNNKVKVICILDITGQLGNMAFNFDLQLPNVSDETRQLVRSLISTEEEMNMQMIYLLGLGRFYTNEYARAMGEGSSSSAVNSLLSSTISGQINQMLSNVIGTDSKWNFGTGLSTGELGWQDLDIEGILSGRLLDDRLLINGNFGYRDNALTQNASFIGDFDVKWRIRPNGNTYLKAYNQNNDRYFTKSTLNTQGIGISYQKDFDKWPSLFSRKKKKAL